MASCNSVDAELQAQTNYRDNQNAWSTSRRGRIQQADHREAAITSGQHIPGCLLTLTNAAAWLIFANKKLMQKKNPEKITETLAHNLIVLSERFPLNTNMTGFYTVFKTFFAFFAH